MDGQEASILDELRTTDEYNPRIVFTVVSILSLLANLTNVVRIAAWKHLRSNITYITILHVCITHSISVVAHNYRLWYYADFQFEDLSTVRVLDQGTNSLNFGLYLLMLLVLCLWYTSCYCTGEAWSKLRKYFLLFNVLEDVIVNVIIFVARYHASSLKPHSLIAPSLFTFVALTITLLLAHSYRFYTKQQTSHPGLTVTGIFVALWTPYIFYNALGDDQSVNLMLYALANANPVFILAYLWKYDFVFKNDKVTEERQDNNGVV